MFIIAALRDAEMSPLIFYIEVIVSSFQMLRMIVKFAAILPFYLFTAFIILNRKKKISNKKESNLITKELINNFARKH